MTVKKHYTLSNGVEIPSVGFGTWQIPSGEEAYNSTLFALKSGYRHIDTAAAYQNERSIGEAIRDFGIKREDLFITSKLRAEKKGYAVAMQEFNDTLERLGTDYLDLYLIHAPKPWGTPGDGMDYMELNIESWKAFIDLHNAGKIRSIGVSNFKPMHLQPLIEATKVVPQVDQIYLCPGSMQDETVEFAKKHNILIEAYSPFATGRLFKAKNINEIAEKYGKSPAQIALRWSLQRGFLPLPKSVTPERIKANLDVFDFEISEADMQLIDKLDVPPRN
ncbi:MAG: aldo/keto reductase [Bacilli bacterium]|nr:aldo/keto reductase [Bacilli bacterium]MBN2696251.1 aldo/keto reductase [Bacilli bacterium]